jgi:hypothetical protein
MEKRLGLVFAVVGSAFLHGACVPTNPELREKLLTRARFDLDCDELRLRPLEKTNGYVTSYGVTRCDRRATYVLNPSSQSWIMNVSDGQAVGRTAKDSE